MKLAALSAGLPQQQSPTLVADTISKSQACFASFKEVRKDPRTELLDLSDEQMRELVKLQKDLTLAMLHHEMCCFEIIFNAHKNREDRQLAMQYEVELKQRISLLEQIDFEWSEFDRGMRYQLFLYRGVLLNLEKQPGIIAPALVVP